MRREKGKTRIVTRWTDRVLSIRRQRNKGRQKARKRAVSSFMRFSMYTFVCEPPPASCTVSCTSRYICMFSICA